VPDCGTHIRIGAFPLGSFLEPVHRRELLRQGWKDVGKVFLLATILDVVYQLIVHRGVYTLELLITAVTLAIVPHFLVRGPISRIAKMVFAARHAATNPFIFNVVLGGHSESGRVIAHRIASQRRTRSRSLD